MDPLDPETQRRVDEISDFLKEALKPFIGNYNVTSHTMDTLKKIIEDNLPPLPEHDWNVVATPVEGSPTEIRITFTPPEWMVHYDDEF